MEKDTLIHDYEETVQKQAVLLTRQQATIDSLHEEAAAQQHRAEAAAKQLNSRLDSLLQQAKTDTFHEATEEINLLKQELKTALKEKEACQSEGRRQGLEVQRLHQALLASQGSHIPSKECEEYMRAVEALEEETQRLRTQVAEAEEERVATLKSNHDLKKEVASIGSLLDQEKQSAEVLRSLLEEKDASVQETRESFTALNKKLLEQGEDLRILMTQAQALKAERDHLAKVLQNVKEKLKEAQARVAESVHIAEDSLVEKDAALLREKHALNEVKRLEGVVASLSEEAGRKAQAEVCKVKDDYNANIKKVSQEVVRLEMALGEKELECDRCQRELKKMMEGVEQLQEEAGQRKEHHRQETLHLQKRITTLETQLSAIIAARDRLLSLGQQSAKEVEEQKEDLLARISELEIHLSRVRNECAAAKLEGEEAKRSMAKAAAQLEKLREESSTSQEFLKRQLRLKVEEVEELTTCAEVNIEVTNSTHRKALTQCYENTAAFQDTCTRLQAQLKEQKKEYEQRMSQLRCRLQEAQEQQQHTALSLHKANTSMAVTQDLAELYKARVAEVEQRLQMAERRFLMLKHPSKYEKANTS